MCKSWGIKAVQWLPSLSSHSKKVVQWQAGWAKRYASTRVWTVVALRHCHCEDTGASNTLFSPTPGNRPDRIRQASVQNKRLSRSSPRISKTVVCCNAKVNWKKKKRLPKKCLKQSLEPKLEECCLLVPQYKRQKESALHFVEGCLNSLHLTKKTNKQAQTSHRQLKFYTNKSRKIQFTGATGRESVRFIKRLSCLWVIYFCWCC